LAEAKKKCFVIMPFSRTREHHSEEYWKRHFESYLKPLIEKNQQLEAFRSEPLRGDIAIQIITDLTSADIVVADLTDHNPNVLWELGVRQSFKHCTITIAETGTQIPFHFSHKGILFYNGEHLDNQLFEQQLLDALRNCLEKPNEPDSPVLQALGGRGTLYSIIHAEENSRRIQAIQMEIESNNTETNLIWHSCEQNKKLRTESKPQECLMQSTLLRSAAIELLYVDRYVDLGQDFYSIVRRYYDDIETINYHLAQWAEHPDSMEEWLAKEKPVYEANAASLMEYLKKAIG